MHRLGREYNLEFSVYKEGIFWEGEWIYGYQIYKAFLGWVLEVKFEERDYTNRKKEKQIHKDIVIHYYYNEKTN